MEKRYLAMWMWLCEGKLKVKTAHFRLPSASQKRACLRGEKLNYKSVAKEISKPPFFGSWSPVGTEILPCLFDSRFL